MPTGTLHMNLELELPTAEIDSLVRQISSAKSPVGIDAQKTHAVIIHLLLDIQERLQRLEKTNAN